jgi:hypothetical protein
MHYHENGFDFTTCYRITFGTLTQSRTKLVLYLLPRLPGLDVASSENEAE